MSMIRKYKSRGLLFGAFLFCISLNGVANVVPNTLFSNNMVLQRGTKVPVWGKADDNENVTVEMCGQKVTTVAKDGKWFVQLQPLKAGGPFELVIKGNNIVTISNVLVGEVWLCSGQSNMERKIGQAMVKKEYLWADEIKNANNYPLIRQYTVPELPSTMPIDDANGKWEICDTGTVKGFTAVGYFFAKKIQENLNVPVGLLFSAYGGSQADRWMSRATMENNPELNYIVREYDSSIKAYPIAMEKYKNDEPKLQERWLADSIKLAAMNKRITYHYHPPTHPDLYGSCGGLYNGMLHPLIPYGIKGILWYQGESDRGKAKLYRPKFKGIIDEWRKDWNNSELPFLFVQLPGYKDYNPEIREAQYLIWKTVPKTSMVVVLDYGDSTNMHPINKKPVGERLALAARAIAYNQKVAYAGPVYKSMKVLGNKIELSFDFVYSGFDVHGDTLSDFVIAGNDRKFVPAKAEIKGDKIIVSAEGVDNPVAVRYGWRFMPTINLYNKEGLMAAPFRTDDWEKK